MITNNCAVDVNEIAESLRKAGLRATEPRISVLGLLLKHPERHHTADQIYHKLKSGHPSLSKTTVYNALQAMRRTGVVHGLTITEDEVLHGVGDGNHHHFYCKKCYSITDVDVACPLLGKMVQNAGFVDEIHGYFKGICKSCVKEEK